MMPRTLTPLLLAGLLCVPLAGHAGLSAYSQNFEAVAPAEPGNGNNDALSQNGWLAWGNVYSPGGQWLQSYGAGPAPNGSLAFSGVDTTGGGPAQGNRHLVVYSDYNNSVAHQGGLWLESLVLQNQTVSAADQGSTWVFRFDAKRGNLAAPSTAMAFLKTLDPATGFQPSAFSMVDLSAAPSAWVSHAIELTIPAGAGHLLQFGFANTATGYAGSSMAYDNLSLSLALVPEAATAGMMLAGLALLGLAGRGRRPGR